jgi:hypothetical protein
MNDAIDIYIKPADFAYVDFLMIKIFLIDCDFLLMKIVE